MRPDVSVNLNSRLIQLAVELDPEMSNASFAERLETVIDYAEEKHNQEEISDVINDLDLDQQDSLSGQSLEEPF